MVPICSKLSYFSACKKSTSSLTFFLRYCKEIANLLFCVIWACLATQTPKMIKAIWRNLFIFRQKIKFILELFFEILQRYCKLTAFGTLGMHDFGQTQSDTINLQKTFAFICRQKINPRPMLFWRYCKDVQTSYFGYFSINLKKRLRCLSACQK